MTWGSNGNRTRLHRVRIRQALRRRRRPMAQTRARPRHQRRLRGVMWEAERPRQQTIEIYNGRADLASLAMSLAACGACWGRWRGWREGDVRVA